MAAPAADIYLAIIARRLAGAGAESRRAGGAAGGRAAMRRRTGTAPPGPRPTSARVRGPIFPFHCNSVRVVSSISLMGPPVELAFACILNNYSFRIILESLLSGKMVEIIV